MFNNIYHKLPPKPGKYECLILYFDTSDVPVNLIKILYFNGIIFESNEDFRKIEAFPINRNFEPHVGYIEGWK